MLSTLLCRMDLMSLDPHIGFKVLDVISSIAILKAPLSDLRVEIYVIVTYRKRRRKMSKTCGRHEDKHSNGKRSSYKSQVATRVLRCTGGPNLQTEVI